MRFHTLISFIGLVLILPVRVWAHPVISEVMWMGSDLSTSDEWLEITNPDEEDIDVSNWTVTSVNSSGKEVVLIRFATGTLLVPDEFLIIASKSAASSRLRADPYFVSSTITIPNTKLVLRIRDATNAIIDEVDDGIGAPFAGDNPSGSGSKASMERIDYVAAGTIKENWKTAVTSEGFDEGAHVLGTPGYGPILIIAETPTEETEELESEPVVIASTEPVCTDPLQIAISLQSGPLVAIGKATVNFQAAATAGSLSGVSCSWVYGDGFTSQSCNPPSHSFTVAGTYNVRLEAKNKCGTTLVQTQDVVVQPDPTGSGGSPETSYYEGSRLALAGALPNPEGTDTGKEWIEIRNLEEKAVDLRGWKISLGETTYTWYSLKDSIAPGQTLRLYNSELKFSLQNTASKLRLVTPSGVALSTIPWPSTDEGIVYFPDDLRSLKVMGRVAQVTGPLTFQMELQPDAATVYGDSLVTITLLGLEPLDVQTNEGPYEYIGDLLKNKNVELEFDTYLWDDMGRLQAYVYSENIFVQNQLLISKLWKVDSALDYKKKSALKDFEKSVWKGETPGAENSSRDQKMYSSISPDSSLLYISEVYPSPFPKSSGIQEGDWKGEEWIELANPDQYSLSLDGWKLEIGKKKKDLPVGLRTISGSYIVLKMSSIKSSLKNAGDTVRLLRPDGSIASEVMYPELKNGLSFSVEKEGGGCITINPTPGMPNECVAPMTTKQKAVARKVTAKKTAAAKSAAKVKSFAATYTAQIPEEPDPEQGVVFIEEENEGSPYGILLSFVLGTGASGGVFVFRQRISSALGMFNT